MLSPIVRDVQRQRCSKRGSGDGQRLSLYDYGTTERSFRAVERWGSTLTCTVCMAADSEELQICTTCLFAESVGLWKRRRYVLLVCMLSHVCFLPSWSWSTLLFERGLGEEGRFDVASRSQTPKTSCQNHKQQLLRPRSGPSKVAHTLLLLLFASTKFCDLGIPTILRVLIFAISRSRAKFCDLAQPKVKAQL